MRARWLIAALFVLALGGAATALHIERANRGAPAHHPHYDHNEIEMLRAERRAFEKSRVIGKEIAISTLIEMAEGSGYDAARQ